MSDLFEQLPISKNLYFKFILNYSLGYVKFKTTQVTASGADAATSTPLWYKLTQTDAAPSNNIFPLMVASSRPGQPMDALCTVDNKEIVLQCAIQKLTALSATAHAGYTISHPLTNVRLYAELLTLSPEAEKSYLSSTDTKVINYRDYYFYNIPAVSANTSIQQLLSNGIVGATKLLLIPLLTYDTTSNNGWDSWASPFTTAPFTTAPLAKVINYNVVYSGINLYQTNESYTYQQYLEELTYDGSINGNQSVGLTSGLIDKHSWEQTFGFYVSTLSRRLPSEDLVPRSLQIQFTNASKRTIGYWAFIECLRSITLSISSGELLA
jgi:hypothetical protein